MLSVILTAVWLCLCMFVAGILRVLPRTNQYSLTTIYSIGMYLFCVTTGATIAYIVGELWYVVIPSFIVGVVLYFVGRRIGTYAQQFKIERCQ